MTSIEDINQAEMDTAAQSINKPVIINYLFCPHVPSGQGTVLSPEGEAVMMKYEDLPWKALAEQLQQAITDMGLPKAIKVYVGSDALDLFDINPFSMAGKCMSKASFKDFRAGIVRAPGADTQLHVSPVRPGAARTPPAALFVSVRFGTVSQLGDYIYSVTEAIFGNGDSPLLFKESRLLGPAAMPEVISRWLLASTGAVYADECSIVRLPATRS